jgi:hypothetical protein
LGVRCWVFAAGDMGALGSTLDVESWVFGGRGCLRRESQAEEVGSIRIGGMRFESAVVELSVRH